MQIRKLSIPTICRIQGAAIGGGCGFASVTDFSVTHVEAKMGYPEVNLGVCPAISAPWLIKKIGAGRARAMLLLGGTITGKAAFESGLVSSLVAEPEDLDGEVKRLVQELTSGGMQALAATKMWLNELDGSTIESVVEQASRISAEEIRHPEAQEAIRRRFG